MQSPYRHVVLVCQSHRCGVNLCDAVVGVGDNVQTLPGGITPGIPNIAVAALMRARVHLVHDKPRQPVLWINCLSLQHLYAPTIGYPVSS